MLGEARALSGNLIPTLLGKLLNPNLQFGALLLLLAYLPLQSVLVQILQLAGVLVFLARACPVKQRLRPDVKTPVEFVYPGERPVGFRPLPAASS